MEIGLFKLQHSSVLKAQPRQHISNMYIYLYLSYQSAYTGSKVHTMNISVASAYDTMNISLVCTYYENISSIVVDIYIRLEYLKVKCWS